MPNVVHNILKHVELQNKNAKWDEFILNVGVNMEVILKYYFRGVIEESILTSSVFGSERVKVITFFFSQFGI